MTPVSHFMCLTFVFQSFLRLNSLPVPDGTGDGQDSARRWQEYESTFHRRTPHKLKESHTSWQLNRSGPWSQERPRCGVPDYMAHGGKRRRTRYALYGERWSKTDLTYKIASYPRQIHQDSVRWVMKEAQRIWSEVSQLTFSEVSSGEADIVIDFVSYRHGDNLPFDGPGGVLAHAFFPKTLQQGKIHFDYDEFWTVRGNKGMNLLHVAVHEFGHVLGLQHSWDPSAVMSAFYSFSSPLALSEDDKRGIQHLYGTRSPTVIETHHIEETNEITTSVPNACHTDFDAASVIRGDLFFFKSSYMWRIRDGRLLHGYPTLASRQWEGIPNSIDAAFEDKSGKIWFFQGHYFWTYDGTRLVRGPELVSGLGLPISNIQASLTWGDDNAQWTYFFKDNNYWLFDPYSSKVERPNPHGMQNWKGVPGNIDGAFLDQHGYANFLSDKRYWKFDPVKKKVLEGYPRYIGIDFFGCQGL